MKKSDDFDRDFAETRRRIQRQNRLVFFAAWIGMMAAAFVIAAAVYLVVVNPEAIGHFFVRVASGFRQG